MFFYWAVKDNNVIDVEVLSKQHVDDAKLNSDSRQSELHRDRKIAIGSQTNTKVITAERMCSNSAWQRAKRKLKGDGGTKSKVNEFVAPHASVSFEMIT